MANQKVFGRITFLQVSSNQREIEKTIYSGYNVVLWPDDLKEKDINDMILSGLTKNTLSALILDVAG